MRAPLLGWAIAVLVGCGRIGFDATGTGSGSSSPDGSTGSLQPDLRQLLPTEVANLVGYWRMDGDWRDASPRGNDLAIETGTPAFSSDSVVAQSGDLYDTSFQVSNRPSIEIAYLSYSAWFTSDPINTANSNSGQTVFKFSCATCGGDPDIDIAFTVQAGNDGTIYAGAVTLPPGTITANAWHHVAGVYAATGERVYVDGVRVYTDPTARPPLQTTGGYLEIAQLWPNIGPLWNPQYLHGKMDELAIWSSALDEASILAIYANQHR